MFPSIGIKHVVRAVLLGALVFLLWSLSPAMMLRMAGVKPPVAARAANSETAEPVYRDKTGKRINEADFHIAVGYDKADQEGISSHAVCKAMANSLEQLGCSRYVTEHKPIGPAIRQQDFASGRAPAQCRAEVSAHWEPRIQDQREQGNERAASSWHLRDYLPELRQCDLYDRARPPSSGVQPTAIVPATTVLPSRPALPATAAAAAATVEPVAVSAQCASIQARLDELARADKRDQVKLAALRGADGVVIDPASWTTLNQARIDRMAELQQFSSAAAGCSNAQPR